MLKKDFKIENNIYNEEIIKNAIIDFKWFNIKYLKSILKISWNSDIEIEQIFNEFMNYVLWVQNETI